MKKKENIVERNSTDIEYSRLLENHIPKDFFKGKAIVLVGARQVGKTTLVERILQRIQDIESENYKILRVNADNPTDRDLFQNKDIEELAGVVGNNDIIYIDEAQRIEDVGLTIKLLVDRYKDKKQIIVTGSSSINLLENTSESLTGRKYTYFLYPLSLQEYNMQQGALTTRKLLETNILYGMYPDIVRTESHEDKKRLLRELTNSYLFKDILELKGLKNPQILTDLLRALALQIGSEVSYSELSSTLSVDIKTVGRYIDLLEKSFVVFRMDAFARNKRREISKNKKIYFYDTGVRNVLVDNFNPLDLRVDKGALWENYIISERLKYRAYNGIYANAYFWRTYDGSEIDLIEERSNQLYGYEIKYNQSKSNARKKPPSKWNEYPSSHYEVIDINRLDGFVF